MLLSPWEQLPALALRMCGCAGLCVPGRSRAGRAAVRPVLPSSVRVLPRLSTSIEPSAFAGVGKRTSHGGRRTVQRKVLQRAAAL